MVRYNQILGVKDIDIPEDGYHGQYLIDIAENSQMNRKIGTKKNGMIKFHNFFERLR